MAFQPGNQPLMGDAMATHDFGQHDLVGRFGEGHGGGHPLDLAALYPGEQIGTVLGQHGRLDQMVVENGGIEIAAGPIG